MRRAATRSALCRPSFAPTAARGYSSVLEAGGRLGEREKAVEDRAIRGHDLELLKKLRDTLGIQENQPIPETVVSQVSSSSSSLNPFAQRAQSQRGLELLTCEDEGRQRWTRPRRGATGR